MESRVIVWLLSTLMVLIRICHDGTTISRLWARPSGIFKLPTTHTCVAERCIRFLLPKIINDTDPSVTDQVYTHSFQVFTTYVKVTKINYATRCLIYSKLLDMSTLVTHKLIECLCSELIRFLMCHMFLWRCHGDVASLCFWDWMFHAVYRISKVYLRTLDNEHRIYRRKRN